MTALQIIEAGAAAFFLLVLHGAWEMVRSLPLDRGDD